MSHADPILIDGSHGEGGGQILRSSLALSVITGKPFRIENIRANRDKPGLRRQHLTAVLSAAKICSATVTGAVIESRQLAFWPGKLKPGEYAFDVGSAGSTTLVFQTVLPPLMLADAPSQLVLQGGTHNIHAPPFDFLAKTFLPLLNRMGPRVTVELERAGFLPAGGGKFVARIEPVRELTALLLNQRGPIVYRKAVAICANLPPEIGQRELAVIKKGLKWTDESVQLVHRMGEPGPGNIVMIELGSKEVTEVFTGFGQRGVRAAAVAEGALHEAQKYLEANVPVGQCLADQLILPFALAGGGSFTTMALSQHTETNIDVVRRFLDAPIDWRQMPEGSWQVRIGR